MTLPTPEAAEQTRKFIRKAGGDSTWDRLAEYLAKQESGKERFVINRAFDAPIETVWEMWANPDHFRRWLPPYGRLDHLELVKGPPGSSGKPDYYLVTERTRLLTKVPVSIAEQVEQDVGAVVK